MNEKPTMVIPGNNTIKALDIRRKYILKKLDNNRAENNQADISRYSFLINEIRALERVINFIKWLADNSEDDAVKQVAEKYKNENKQNETKSPNKMVVVKRVQK